MCRQPQQTNKLHARLFISFNIKSTLQKVIITGTGIGNLVPEKVSEPVSEKFDTGKKYRNRYRKNLVPELILVAKI